MTSAQLYYLLNLLIYAGVDIIACLGLSQQFGVAGVTNFGFIIFQAAGAYTAANRSLARNCGIRTDRIVAATWALSGALCGIAGTVFAINNGSFGATSADLFLVVILAAVFLGGPGSAYGAMLGALIIGLATEISAAYITPSYKDVIAFAVLLIMLAVRPSGLLGTAVS